MAAPRTAPDLSRRHTRTRCVQCGLSAEAIPASCLAECPRCGCDLTARPPRSYAQMEGLYELPEDPRRIDARRIAAADAAAARWLVVLGCVALAAAGTLLGAVLTAGR